MFVGVMICAQLTTKNACTYFFIGALIFSVVGWTAFLFCFELRNQDDKVDPQVPDDSVSEAELQIIKNEGHRDGALV
jgi:Na+/melibiose symporter-like transporter